MKQKIKKWTIRLTATFLLIVALLLIIILNPILTYAYKTNYKNYTIFHNKTLDTTLFNTLNDATALITKSELYNPKLRLQVCLNDGSNYPNLIKKIQAEAFAWGFYNKVVLYGNAQYHKNTVELNGYYWNLKQLLAHEMTHCLQFNKLGFWKSNPIANIPQWKWEGYAEYVSRQNDDQKNLLDNITHFVTTDKNKWEIQFADHTITSREYYEYWTLIQFCMDIKKMSYRQILSDTTGKEIIKSTMMKWYDENYKKSTSSY